MFDFDGILEIPSNGTSVCITETTNHGRAEELLAWPV
jgi:hypothetical protein